MSIGQLIPDGSFESKTGCTLHHPDHSQLQWKQLHPRKLKSRAMATSLWTMYMLGSHKQCN